MGIVERALAVGVVMVWSAGGLAAAETTPAEPAPAAAPSGTAATPPAPAPAPATPAPPPAPAAAAPAMPATPPAAAGPASPDVLTGAAAWEKLKGNTITGKVSGEAFAEYFAPDGSVKYVDKDGLSTGTWIVSNAKVCFDFPDDDDRSCSVFTVLGAGGSAIDDDGMTTRFEILPGNSKGL